MLKRKYSFWIEQVWFAIATPLIAVGGCRRAPVASECGQRVANLAELRKALENRSGVAALNIQRGNTNLYVLIR